MPESRREEWRLYQNKHTREKIPGQHEWWASGEIWWNILNPSQEGTKSEENIKTNIVNWMKETRSEWSTVEEKKLKNSKEFDSKKVDLCGKSERSFRKKLFLFQILLAVYGKSKNSCFNPKNVICMFCTKKTISWKVQLRIGKFQRFLILGYINFQAALKTLIRIYGNYFS